jgi:hypothetical protein
MPNDTGVQRRVRKEVFGGRGLREAFGLGLDRVHGVDVLDQVRTRTEPPVRVMRIWRTISGANIDTSAP